MRIIIETAHPANVHYFKNFIFQMKIKGHKIHLLARKKDVSFKLLRFYKLPFVEFGTGKLGKGIVGKILYIFYADVIMLIQFIKFRPDIGVSFGSGHIGRCCFLFRKPHITFEDTEHAKMNMYLYKPFCDIILTPSSFYLNMGKKQFKFNSNMELFYLHKNWFSPSVEILRSYGIDTGKPFVLMRFVSWEAFHDIGHKGLTLENKIKLIETSKHYANVYISSEGQIPPELIDYELNIEPVHIHHFLAFASLYVGEGGTMASECAVLGTPSIYVNSLPLMGYLKDAEKSGLLYHLSDFNQILEKLKGILSHNNKDVFFKRRMELLENKIDPTSLLIWLVENYPKSKMTLKSNPDYQNNFK